MTFGPLGLDMNGVSAGAAVMERPERPRVNVYARRAPLQTLAVVEIPLLGLIGLMFAVSLLVAPGNTIRGTGLDLPDLIVCPFFAAVHVPCLLCGLTRSYLAMGGLDVRQAFIFHPLGPVLYLGMLGMGALMAWSLIRRRRLSLHLNQTARAAALRFGVAILVGAWVLKVVIWRQTGLL